MLDFSLGSFSNMHVAFILRKQKKKEYAPTRLHQHSAGYLCSRGAAHVACCCSPRRRGHGPLRRFASPFRSASSRPDRSGLFPDGGTWRVPSILRHRGCPTPTSRSSNSWQILTERRHRISSPCRCRCRRRCRREMIFFSLRLRRKMEK